MYNEADIYLDKDGWELLSAVAQHKNYPATFQIPTEEELSQLKVGDMVQLLFLLQDKSERGSSGDYIAQVERMWVTLKEITDNYFIGQLESEPYTSDVLKPGDLIKFTHEFVATILIRENDPRHPNYKKE